MAACSPVAAQVRKPSVSVTGIEDLANTGQATAFARMIETAVTSTGKFRVTEDNHAKLLERQDKAARGIVTTRTPGRTGGFEGADFLIYGTITSASSHRKNDVFGTMFSGVLNGGQKSTCARAVAALAIDVRIVDASSGEVRFTQRLNQTAESQSSCTGDAGVDVGNLLRTAADKIAGGLVTTLYPIKVAGVQADGTILLNYGEGTVIPGAIMTVFGPGVKVVDPDTGAVLTDEGTPLGNVRIVDVQSRFSKAQPLTAFSAPPPKGSIVRPAVVSMPTKGKRK